MRPEFPDTCIYNGQEYYILTLSEPLSFDPHKHRLYPSFGCVACSNGYLRGYKIVDGTLYFDKLSVYTKQEHLPKIFDKRAKNDRDLLFNALYENIQHKLNYTGNILLGKGILSEWSGNLCCENAWTFVDVLELKFVSGKLVEAIDHSKFVASLREKIKRNEFASGEHLQAYLKRDFSLGRQVNELWI
ncbi:MAG: hypothetical protein Q4D21_02595 [Phascolarctobacterium sp.]|nr:hypothetical protein [Phascolarctobacterium sp.]